MTTSYVIPGNALCRVVDNLSLFNDEYTHGLVWVGLDYTGIQVLTTDRYTAAFDSIEAPHRGGEGAVEIEVSFAGLQLMSRTVRDHKIGKKPVTLRWDGVLLGLVLDGDEIWSAAVDGSVNSWKIEWGRVLEVFDQVPAPVMLPWVAIGPDRFAKLARVKSDPKAPADFWFHGSNLGELMVVKIGPTFRAVSKCLDRPTVREHLGEAADACLWM